MPHVGRWAIIGSAISLVVLSLGLVAFSGSSTSGSVLPSLVVCSEPDQSTSCQPDPHLDTVAPMAPAAWLPEGFPLSYVSGSSGPSGTSFDYQVSSGQPSPPITQAHSNWTDVRFEAWHALPMNEPGPGGIDTRYSAPFAVQPAVSSGGHLTAVFHFERLRDASWWVVLTAVGPDGHRYRLEDGQYGTSDFNGSAWDWLTAPQ